MELVRKKPGTSTDLQASELLVSTEQTMQPCLSEEANGCHRNSRILIDGESPPNCTQERPNPEASADIEGLKLDLLNLQKKKLKKIQGFCPLLIPNIKTKMLLVPNSLITRRGAKRYYPLFPKKTMQSKSWKKNV